MINAQINNSIIIFIYYIIILNKKWLKSKYFIYIKIKNLKIDTYN